MTCKFKRISAVIISAFMLLSLSACGTKNKENAPDSQSGIAEKEDISENNPITLKISDYEMRLDEYNFTKEQVSYIGNIINSMSSDLSDAKIANVADIKSALAGFSAFCNTENIDKSVSYLKSLSYYAKQNGINPTPEEVDSFISSSTKKLKLIPLALILNKPVKKIADSYVNELCSYIGSMKASEQSKYFYTLMTDVYCLTKLYEQYEGTEPVAEHFENISKSVNVQIDDSLIGSAEK